MSNRAVHTFVGPSFQIGDPAKPQRAWKWAYSAVRSYGSPFTIKFTTRLEAIKQRSQVLKSNEPSTYPVSSHKLLTGVQNALNQIYEDATFKTPPTPVVDDAPMFDLGPDLDAMVEMPGPDRVSDSME
jgi:hypothetical protein